MDPIVGAALVSGLISLIGGIGNIISTNRINKQNVQSTEDINAFNNKEQWKMYYETRNYNDYSSQIQRAIDAGLNPNVVFNNGNTAASVNVGNSVSPQRQNFDFSFLSSMFTPFIDALSNKENIRGQKLSNDLFEDTYKDKVELSSHELKRIQADVTILGYAIEDRDIDKAIKQAEKTLKTLGAQEADINYQHDKWLHDNGLPPDLGAKEQMLVGLILRISKALGREISLPGLFDEVENMVKSIGSSDTNKINFK